MKSESDLAFIAWAEKRHKWLWNMGFGRRRLKSNCARRIAQRAACMLLSVDRMAWVAFVGR